MVETETLTLCLISHSLQVALASRWIEPDLPRRMRAMVGFRRMRTDDMVQGVVSVPSASGRALNKRGVPVLEYEQV